MYLNMTRSQLWNFVNKTSTDELIDFLELNGLELVKFDEPFVGIYRRELGADLIRYDESGRWVRVPWSGDDEGDHISWAVFDGADWWVHVLDDQNFPVMDGIRLKFDEDGNRVE